MNRNKKAFYFIVAVVMLIVTMLPSSQVAFAAPPLGHYQVDSHVSTDFTGETRIVDLGVLHEW